MFADMMRISRSIFPLLAILTLWYCNEPATVQQPLIFGDLYMRFLQETGQIKAEASFFEGDSLSSAQPKELTGGVSFLGSGMESRRIGDRLLRYQYIGNGQFPEKPVFVVRGEADGEYRFETNMVPVDSFSADTTLSKSAPYRIGLNGMPLQAEESLVLLFSDGAGKAWPVTLLGPLDGPDIVLTPEQLAPLAVGRGQLYLVKKQRKEIEEGLYSVLLVVEYYTKSQDLVIVD